MPSLDIDRKGTRGRLPSARLPLRADAKRSLRKPQAGHDDPARRTVAPLGRRGCAGGLVRIRVPTDGPHRAAPIPKRLVQTWHSDASKLPPRVVRTARAFAPGFVHSYYSDARCIDFLRKNFGETYVRKFHELKLGPHKADLFRYCYLYLKGGVYMDIDMEPMVSVRQIMVGVPPGTLVTCLEANRAGVFQAFIATPPGHPIFKTLIAEFFSSRVRGGSPPSYTHFTRHMGQVLAGWRGAKLTTGLQTLRDGSRLYLFHERAAPPGAALPGYYVMKGPVAVFRSRYPNYRGCTHGTVHSHF